MFAPDRGSEVAVLADPETSRLGYALLSSVVAVEVRNPVPFQDVLTGGRLPLPVTGEPVTPLALQRELAPAEEFPLDVPVPGPAHNKRVTGRSASRPSRSRPAACWPGSWTGQAPGRR
jgi:hypothetical protein